MNLNSNHCLLMSKSLFIFSDIIFMFKFFLFLLVLLFFFILLLLLFTNIGIVKLYWSDNLKSYLRAIFVHIITFISLLFFCIAFFVINFWHGYGIDINNLDITGIFVKRDIINITLFNSQILSFTLSKFSISIGLLFSILAPTIIILMGSDFDENGVKFYLYMLLIFKCSFFLIFTNNIIVLYFLYEVILLLVFSVMYLSSNSRGGIEATMFFAGWAILGSILVGLAVIILVVLTNEVLFSRLILNKLTASETYYIYLLIFFGFGTKLSTWPFWYWLPRAHVEVSTSMSIFLSCILIKLSYFCLIRIQLVLLTEISLNICILVTLLCSIDIVFRLMSQKDLKAIIAYSSVLHTNLLLTLLHLDMPRAMSTSMLYVWGHSLATACLFICVSMIEARFGSRSVIYVSGLWSVNPSLACLTFWSLLSFLDFPCTMFFWGELWLWNVLFANLPFLSIQVIFICVVLFSSIFFKIWWCVLFGSFDISAELPQDLDSYENWIILITLIVIQIITGFQPSIISVIVNFII